MACFAVPAAEAAVVGVVYAVAKYKEKKAALAHTQGAAAEPQKTSFTKKLSWLIKLLVGGSFLLAFEHIWHGEVVPWPPFLTAASDPADMAEVLHEMATVGVTMAVAVTVVWAGIVIVSSVLEKRTDTKPAEDKA